MKSYNIQELIQDLCNFAEDPKNIILREFIAQKKMSYHQFTVLLHDHPELMEAYNYARLHIGIRREKKALTYDINTSVYRDTQPIYDDELRNWEMEKKKNNITIDDGLKKLELIYAKSKE